MTDGGDLLDTPRGSGPSSHRSGRAGIGGHLEADHICLCIASTLSARLCKQSWQISRRGFSGMAMMIGVPARNPATSCFVGRRMPSAPHSGHFVGTLPFYWPPCATVQIRGVRREVVTKGKPKSVCRYARLRFQAINPRPARPEITRAKEPGSGTAFALV